MGDEIEAFFDGLAQRAPQLLPEKFAGTIRFDITSADRIDHWCVEMRKGNAFVTREERPADTVVRADRELFLRLVSGEMGVNSAAWSGQTSVEGSYLLMIVFKRFFYSPPGSRDPRELARELVGQRRRERWRT